jgi:hypothetical protein
MSTYQTNILSTRNLEASMTSLEDRVRALEDELGIMRTLARYSWAKDHGDDATLLKDCFTDDGTFTWYPTGKWSEPSTARFEGRDAIVAWDEEVIANRNRPGKFGKHMLSLPTISLDGDRAEVETYLVRVVESDAGPVIGTMGRYRDVFVRCDDGRWRIQERRLEREGTNPPGPIRAG